MPKTLVLFDTTRPESGALATLVAEGARSVRFAEVDLRSLEDAVDLGVYDGIALDASSAPLLRLAEGAGALRSKVGALFAGTDAGAVALLEVMARAGMIILPPGTGSSALTASDADSARVLGKRLADVVGWITHARSHHHHR